MNHLIKLITPQILCGQMLTCEYSDKTQKPDDLGEVRLLGRKLSSRAFPDINELNEIASV